MPIILFFTGTMGTIPPPILSTEYWSDIDASSFRIRGRTYNQDKVKAASAPSIFKLIAIDVSISNRYYCHNDTIPIVMFILFISYSTARICADLPVVYIFNNYSLIWLQ